MEKKIRPSKAEKYVLKGDSHFQKGKPSKALKEYRKALAEDPNLPGIYDKLITALDQIPDKWNMEEFAESVSWAMKKQEQENPSIKQKHARLDPEWKKAMELTLKIISSSNEEETGRATEELVQMGEIATRALIGLLTEVKKPPLP